MKGWLVGLLPLFCFMQAEAAQGESQSGSNEPTEWLRRIATAPQRLSFSGTFVHRLADRAETTRITHLADADGEHEKQESLDGPPREVVRHNDRISCYLPESRKVRLESARDRHLFPALLSAPADGIAASYTVRILGVDRVAGMDCRVVLLEPKDNLRFARELCAEVNSGLLLRSRMLGQQGESLEQFWFTQIALGERIERDRIRSAFETQGFATDDRLLRVRPIDSGWKVEPPPAGFRRLLEVQRNSEGHPAMVQLVYSDGLAAVSVFIEPGGKRPEMARSPSHQGAINYYALQVGDARVMVLGEVPPETVMQIARAVQAGRN